MGATLALLAIGIYGSTQLEVDWDRDLAFFKVGSRRYKYTQAENEFFPSPWKASICMGHLHYDSQINKIIDLVKELDQLDPVELPFESSWLFALPPNASLYDFATSPAGRPFARFFSISEESKEIVASRIDFQFAKPQPTFKGFALMDKVEALIEEEASKRSVTA